MLYIIDTYVCRLLYSENGIPSTYRGWSRAVNYPLYPNDGLYVSVHELSQKREDEYPTTHKYSTVSISAQGYMRWLPFYDGKETTYHIGGCI